MMICGYVLPSVIESPRAATRVVAFSGSAAVDLDRLRTDLDALLKNFETVSLDLRNGDMRYSLLSLGRSSAEL